jgi:LPS-assembly protein
MILLVILLLGVSPWPGLAQEAPSFNPDPNQKTPVEIQADRLEYQRDTDRYDAVGSVRIIQERFRLQADRIILFNRTGSAEASGHVSFFDGVNSIEAERGEINLRTREGILYRSRLVLQPGDYQIQGEVLEKLSGDRYRVETGSFTTCTCPEGETPAWRFRTGHLRLQLEGYLVARDVTFYVKKLPILYLPWVVYPVKRSRQTGLLIPRIGYSTAEGFKYNQAFFWAMTPHMDSTWTLDTRSRKGEGGGLEYRYKLSRGSEGILSTLFFHDRTINRNRLDLNYYHRQEFSPRVKGRLDLHYLNDNSFFRDLSELTEERSQRNVESNLTLTRRGDTQFAYLLARYTRDLTAPNDQTLQTLPEVGYALMTYRLGSQPLFASLEGSVDNFWREEGIRAQRLDLAPRLFARLEPVEGMVLTPSVGFRETVYSREEVSKESTRREIYWASLRADTKLARTFVLSVGSLLKRLRHQVEPSVIYEYVEQHRESLPPFFDALESLVSFRGFLWEG